MSDVKNSIRPLLFLDYEGTLGTSTLRHYHQYVEALRRLRLSADSTDAKLLEPCSQDFFLANYSKRGFDIRNMLLTETTQTKELEMRNRLKKMHQAIIWEYDPLFMRHEQLLPGAPDLIRAMKSHYEISVVSYTRQAQDAFRSHVCKLGLVPENDNSIQIFTVGSNDTTSKEAKRQFIQSMFADRLQPNGTHRQRAIMIADSISDLEVALSLEIDFAGVTKTGQSTLLQFRECLAASGKRGYAGGESAFFESAFDPALLQHLHNRLIRNV